MDFLKMHGLGNDFVVLDDRNGKIGVLSNENRQLLTDRRRGVGCDQLVVLGTSERADVFMRIYNPDGSEAEACGNATRCVAHLVMSETGIETCSVETVAGLLPCRMIGDLMVEADMGMPKEISDLDLAGEGVADPVSVSMGNPHLVFFVDESEDIDVEKVGAFYETHERFPDKTNVEFVSVLGENRLRMRVWERAAGITLACGSAACASIVAAVRRGVSGRKAEVVMDGGSLYFDWREEDDHVLMSGPVVYVFEGEFKL